MAAIMQCLKNVQITKLPGSSYIGNFYFEIRVWKTLLQANL